ncbi:MAG: glycoside hydrolase family 5 protein, partial [Treponema sp.]|nr:glycoside hydrolase family 5 protein [Treponema sp.]
MNRAGPYITDEKGRILILRGVNLGGSSKIPFGVDGLSPESLEKPESVSFVGRPFPLEEAEEHFDRLKNWGFTFLRFVITWEALEHEGPGIYDESYLAYLRKILLVAEEKGISVFMDPHQDVWSRFSGGDGAPAWTLEKLGMDPSRLEAAGAAVISAATGKKSRQKAKAQEKPVKPQMFWPVNYSFYAPATMFTLFFAGNTFAPQVTIDGESAQNWLQDHYIAAFRHCFRRLKNCKAIAGWGVMNEPHPGYIGYKDLDGLENATLALGPVPSPFQAMIAASGRPVKVPVYSPWLKGWKAFGSKIINPQGVPLFKEGFVC